ncbi:energy-coupling factor transporter transmembrane component T [Brevibacterium sp. BRM-1]|uniref:energy-coupling factor transporter transmembrane component T family protein n=1 Tax=Brevibacterium sp. BRM-1 TaxID=2999062 RepID=UPI00227DDE55|nr:energy-coupling factor transporter transmembrane component T [Brevibacterium sp. BRM-1]WAL39082.1 energy-coupling factor transporter transmembrane component T [Brevibacterium sp. BRM-1]
MSDIVIRSEPAAAPPVAALLPVARRTWVTRCNPVGKIIAMAVLTFGVVLSIDIVSASLMLALIALTAPLAGVRAAVLARRLWFIPLIALGAGYGTALLSEKSGTVLLQLGPVVFSTGSLLAGLAVALRTIDLVLPCVLLAASIDSTELADSLVQICRLPERFVLASLAASRLVGLFAAELATLQMARRARGVGGAGPFAKLAAFFPVSFALLVQAIRRGTRLAMAMEGRAFGTAGRTWSRTSRLGGRDAVLIACSAAMAAAAITAAVATGAWNLIFT